MKIYNITQNILNTKSTLKHKVLYIIYYSVNTVKKLSCRYHSPIILLIKKNLIQWVMIPISCLKTMSDNVHYVNLIPNQLIFVSKVGDCSYFARLLRKITRVGGMQGGATSRLSKNIKTLILQSIWEKKTKKGLGYA